MLKRLLRSPAAQAAAAAAIAFYLRLCFRTTRWTFLGEEHARAVVGRPVILAFWHERLALAALGWLLARESLPGARDQTAQLMVSRHRDGRLIGEVLGRFGVGTVHASSTRGGAAGLRALLRALQGGAATVIAPDGPRGPPRVAAAGVAQLAALSGAPVLPCAARTTRGRRMNSWDRLVLPLPFARGVVAVGAPIAVPRDGAAAALPAIAAALTEACDRADQATGQAPG